APAAAARLREEARVLDPCGSVATRRARAVCPRDARAGPAPAPGLLPARRSDAADRRPRRGRRRPQPAALGPARVHALARAPRRPNADRSATQPVAKRRRLEVRVWVDMTAAAHVVVFPPLIELLRSRVDEVQITAADYA